MTGMSRRAGIGFAIARDHLTSGMTLLVQSWSQHDAEQPWGTEPGGMSSVLADLRAAGAQVEHIEIDLAAPDAPAVVVDRAVKLFGHIDVLVANHARSSKQDLFTVTADELISAGRLTPARACCLHGPTQSNTMTSVGLPSHTFHLGPTSRASWLKSCPTPSQRTPSIK